MRRRGEELREQFASDFDALYKTYLAEIERIDGEMKKIEDCIHCGACSAHCPYGLDTPKLLEDNYKDYKEVLAGKPL